MSNNHGFQGRTRKLSGWVKRFIQPAKESSTESVPLNEPQSRNQGEVEDPLCASRMASDNCSNDSAMTTSKVLWDESPKRVKIREVERERDDTDTVDNVSITPLFSLCSSSAKSSTFSDSHSLQSTRATVVSGRTMETNSSIMAIPPASILDRARASASNTSPSAATSPSISSSAHLHSAGNPRPRPNSSRHMQLQRENSSPTIDSVSTIK